MFPCSTERTPLCTDVTRRWLQWQRVCIVELMQLNQRTGVSCSSVTTAPASWSDVISAVSKVSPKVWSHSKQGSGKCWNSNKSRYGSSRSSKNSKMPESSGSEDLVEVQKEYLKLENVEYMYVDSNWGGLWKLNSLLAAMLDSTSCKWEVMQLWLSRKGAMKTTTLKLR